MLFHEIYGTYYQTVAKILREAATEPLTPRRLRQIVAENAFAESTMFIPDALESGKWPLLGEDGKSLLLAPPEMGITELEKRWLKALLLDPRIALFQPDCAGLEDVEPLYDPAKIRWFDRYADGDPYTDPCYIACFRAFAAAIREKRWMNIRYESARGKQLHMRILPLRMEYSEKDDKFRLRAMVSRGDITVNLSRIREWNPGAQAQLSYTLPQPQSRLLVLELTDNRNALERIMLHFSHLKKETIRLDENRYLLKLWYAPEDELEMLIRVLSFGPVVRVKAPEQFLNLIRARLRKQNNLRTL